MIMFISVWRHADLLPGMNLPLILLLLTSRASFKIFKGSQTKLFLFTSLTLPPSARLYLKVIKVASGRICFSSLVASFPILLLLFCPLIINSDHSLCCKREKEHLHVFIRKTPSLIYSRFHLPLLITTTSISPFLQHIPQNESRDGWFRVPHVCVEIDFVSDDGRSGIGS